VEFRSIVEPARRRLRGVRVVEGRATGVDWTARRLLGRSAVGDLPFAVPFDRLVVAVGSHASDFGVPGVHEHAVGFTSVEDARAVRRRILEQFAFASVPGVPDRELEVALRFVVCGGGPTGVEVAAEIHDLLGEELERAFPGLARRARVILVEAGSRLLAGFDDALSEYASRHFRRGGIDVRTGSPVRAVSAGRVELAGGESIPCGLVVWAAGTEPDPFVRELGVELDRRGRVVVDATFASASRPGLFALGDCAAVGETPLPGTAQVAQKEGAHLAGVLVALDRGRRPRPFEYRSLGMLTYIGSHQALADLPSVKWSGRAAWLFWRSVYITRLVSLSNKAKVLFDWIKARLFGRDLARF
jgi:NADH:ubiquinone reductase (non-electrogenic)